MFGKENFMIIMNKEEEKVVIDNITGVIDMLIKNIMAKRFGVCLMRTVQSLR